MFDKQKQLKKFEQQIEYKIQKSSIRQKFKDTITTSKWTLTFTKKWAKRLMWISVATIVWYMLLATAFFLLPMFLNISTNSEFYSGASSLFEYLTDFMKILISGTVIEFGGYMMKALFETKWEEENKLKSTSDNIEVKDDDIKR